MNSRTFVSEWVAPGFVWFALMGFLAVVVVLALEA